jgi:hypothetical protein
LAPRIEHKCGRCSHCRRISLSFLAIFFLQQRWG